MYKIEDVHNDFNIARTKIYENAQLVVNTSGFKPSEEMEKLHSLGFRSKQVITYMQSKQQFESNLKISQIIMDYKIKYPTNRFIDHVELVNIIKKYSLVVSSTENFIGQIPERNIKAIASFKLKEEDIRYVSGKPGVIGRWVRDMEAEAIIEKESKKREENGDFHYTSHMRRESPQKFINDGSVNFSLSKEQPQPRRDSWETFNTNQNSLIVVGTSDQFDMQRVEAEKNSLRILDNDPIVLCPVEYGYLIVTMWGEEANFQEVKDNSLN